MKYFTIKELCKTSYNIKNEPNAIERANLVCLIENVLDPIRERMGQPIIVTSGFRSAEVNRKVGGVATSQHTMGQASDITLKPQTDNKRLFDTIRKLAKEKKIEFDQLIWEYGNDNYPAWVHISYKQFGTNRGQVLQAKKNHLGKTVYTTIK